jgi:hypothetical protein
MIKEAMQWCRDQARNTVEQITPGALDEFHTLVLDGYHEVPVPQVQTLELSTLASMADYHTLPEVPDEAFFVVDLDGTVCLYLPPHKRTKARTCLARCTVPTPGGLTQCGGKEDRYRAMPAEHMIPRLLTQFEDNADRQALLALLGNVTNGTTHTYTDDGVTQTVATRRGLRMAEMTQLPSPLTLQPKATYPELAPVEQQYVLRAQGGGDDEPPTFKLVRMYDPMFEADRRTTIVEYLDENTNRVVV